MDPTTEEDQQIPNTEEQNTQDQRRPKSKLTKPIRDKANSPGARDGSPPQGGPSKHDVRQAFQVGLNKISQNETREIGLKEIQNVISSNDTPSSLRVYFSSLRDIKRHHNAQTKEVEVLILGYIATVYKKNLLDPLDKPPNLIKSVVRLCDYIHSYFKETNSGVQLACARGLSEIYLNCLEGEANDISADIMIEPLLATLNGGADRAQQHTAAHCLKEMISTFQKQGNIELLEYTSPKIFNLFLKTNHDFSELLESLTMIISKVGVKHLQGKYTAFADKLCTIVGSANNQNQYYLNKVAACGTLIAYAYVLKGAELEQKVLENILEKVLPVLKDASKNKIYKIQQAASDALKFWIALQSSDDPEKGKMENPTRKQEERKARAEAATQEKKSKGSLDNFRAIRSRFKQEKIEDEQEEPARGTSEGRPGIGDLLLAKYGSQNRGQNFMKARSGIGGGHVGWSPDRQEGKKKMSHEQQKKNIKELILQKYGGDWKRPQSEGPGDRKGDKFKFIVDQYQQQQLKEAEEKREDDIEEEEEDDVVMEKQTKKAGHAPSEAIFGAKKTPAVKQPEPKKTPVQVPVLVPKQQSKAVVKEESKSAGISKGNAALEGKLASVLGKSQQEIADEIKERAEQNRKMKGAQPVSQSPQRYRTTKEDKAMEWMDTMELKSEANEVNDRVPVKKQETKVTKKEPLVSDAAKLKNFGKNEPQIDSPSKGLSTNKQPANVKSSVNSNVNNRNQRVGEGVSQRKQKEAVVEESEEENDRQENEDEQEENYERNEEDNEEEQEREEENDEEREQEEWEEEQGEQGQNFDDNMFQFEDVEHGDEGLVSWTKDKLGLNKNKKEDEKAKKEDPAAAKKAEADKKAEAEKKEEKPGFIDRTKNMLGLSKGRKDGEAEGEQKAEAEKREKSPEKPKAEEKEKVGLIDKTKNMLGLSGKKKKDEEEPEPADEKREKSPEKPKAEEKEEKVGLIDKTKNMLGLSGKKKEEKKPEGETTEEKREKSPEKPKAEEKEKVGLIDKTKNMLGLSGKKKKDEEEPEAANEKREKSPEKPKAEDKEEKVGFIDKTKNFLGFSGKKKEKEDKEKEAAEKKEGGNPMPMMPLGGLVQGIQTNVKESTEKEKKPKEEEKAKVEKKDPVPDVGALGGMVKGIQSKTTENKKGEESIEKEAKVEKKEVQIVSNDKSGDKEVDVHANIKKEEVKEVKPKVQKDEEEEPKAKKEEKKPEKQKAVEVVQEQEKEKEVQKKEEKVVESQKKKPEEEVKKVEEKAPAKNQQEQKKQSVQKVHPTIEDNRAIKSSKNAQQQMDEYLENYGYADDDYKVPSPVDNQDNLDPTEEEDNNPVVKQKEEAKKPGLKNKKAGEDLNAKKVVENVKEKAPVQTKSQPQQYKEVERAIRPAGDREKQIREAAEMYNLDYDPEEEERYVAMQKAKAHQQRNEERAIRPATENEKRIREAVEMYNLDYDPEEEARYEAAQRVLAQQRKTEERAIRPAKDLERAIREDAEMHHLDSDRFNTSDERLNQEIIDGVRKNMGIDGSGDKFQRVSIKNEDRLPAIRERVNDEDEMQDSLKDSLSKTRLNNKFGVAQRREAKREDIEESPSIDDVSDVEPENHNKRSQVSVIRAPQRYQEEKKEPRPAERHVEEKHIPVKEVHRVEERREVPVVIPQKVAQEERNVPQQPHVQAFKHVQPAFATQTDAVIQKQHHDFVKEVEHPQYNASNRFSSLYSRGQKGDARRESAPDIAEDIQHEPVHPYPNKNLQNRRESALTKTEPDDDFIESTMDEKTLAMYMKSHSHRQAPAYVNPNPTSQKTSNLRKKIANAQTQLFVSQEPDELEDTQAYGTVIEDYQHQLEVSGLGMKAGRPGVDYLGDTIKSVDLNHAMGMVHNNQKASGIEQKKQDAADVGEVWKEASEALAKEDYETAFSRVLNTGDDIYLIRLLKLTGPCFKKLNRATAMKLLKRIIVLQKSNFFDKLALGFFESAHRTQVTHNMKIEEQNKLLKSLYQMSAKSTAVGQVAANLHEVINMDLRTIG